MNTGQMILTVGAVVLIGLTISTVQSNFSNHGFIFQSMEIGIYKVSLGTSVLEEAMGKAFDENSIDNPLYDVKDLTSSLGKETGEVYPDFDDFDDFNNYTSSMAVEGVDSLFVSCKVVYIDPSDPDGISSGRTWDKKIIVKAWGTVEPDTLTFQHIFSYWSFR